MDWDEKEVWRRKFLQVLAGFRLLDDDFMTAAFQDSLECVDLVLQIILGNPSIKATNAAGHSCMGGSTGIQCRDSTRWKRCGGASS